MNNKKGKFYPIKITKDDLFTFLGSATLEEIAVLKVISPLCKNGPCTATDAYIANQLGYKLRVISKYISNLDKKGYITKERIKIKGTKRVIREILIKNNALSISAPDVLKKFKYIIIPADILQQKLNIRQKIILALVSNIGKENFYASKEYIGALLKMTPKSARELMVKMGVYKNNELKEGSENVVIVKQPVQLTPLKVVNNATLETQVLTITYILYDPKHDIYKIGKTINLASRMKKLCINGIYKVYHININIERELHTRFDSLRINHPSAGDGHTEWFKSSTELCLLANPSKLKKP